MADSRKQRLFELIKKHEGRLVRQRRHAVYRFPSGLRFTMPLTPSDSRSWRNSLSCLKRLLRAQQLRQREA
jgi:hypothetical protein